MSDKLNVCLLNDSFPPIIDGVSNAVYNYAEIIQKSLGNVMIATPKVPDAVDNYPYPVFRYPSIDTTKIFGYRTGNPFDPKSIIALEKQNIDIIHSHCPVMSTLLARTIRKSKDVPLILTYHTKFDIDIAKAIKSDFIQSAALKILALNISACDEVWAVSHGAGENLRKIGYEGKYIVMENGVDFPKGKVDTNEIHLINQIHSLSEDMTVFLFVGRMMWYKGVKISLDGLKIAKEHGKSFKMIFIGDGNDCDEIKKYAEEIGLSEDCIFAGMIQDRELLRAYFSRCDLFLFPSSYDTNGIVVREAAACGLASVLISDSCAAEGVVDGVSGILIDENSKSMAQAIMFACDNPDKLKSIGNNAMNNLYISWEDSVKRAYERYQVVIERMKSVPCIPEDAGREDLFKLVSSLCVGLEKVQDKQERIKTKEQERWEKFKLQSSASKAKEKEQTISEWFKEIKDRYL